MRSLNPQLRDRLRYWRGHGIEFSRFRRPGIRTAQPYWVHLPAWLAGDDGRAGHTRRLDARALRDIVSGQYALYLFARLHDDVVDGTPVPRAAVYAGDDLLIEAERQFARRVGEQPWFWRRFRASVADNVHATAEINRCQRQPGAMGRSSLRLFAKTARILVVGAAAVCTIRDRRHEFARLLPLADELAMAGQIFDDLLDVEEDLQDGRFNFAANCLGIDNRRGSAAARRRLGRAVLIDDAVGSILAEIDTHLDRAAVVAESMKLHEASAFVETLRVESRVFSTAVRRTKVEHLFAALLSPASGAKRPVFPAAPGRRSGIIRRTAATGGKR